MYLHLIYDRVACSEPDKFFPVFHAGARDKPAVALLDVRARLWPIDVRYTKYELCFMALHWLPLLVRSDIIWNARIQIVGKYQSRMKIDL